MAERGEVLSHGLDHNAEARRFVVRRDQNRKDGHATRLDFPCQRTVLSRWRGALTALICFRAKIDPYSHRANLCAGPKPQCGRVYHPRAIRAAAKTPILRARRASAAPLPASWASEKA